MTELRTSYPNLEDVSSGAGLPLHKALPGDAVAGVNMHGALVAKSGSNLALLKLNPVTGALIVDTAGATTNKKSSPAGELAAGSATFAAVTGAEITLTASKVYQNIGVIVSCRRDSIFQLIQQDDVTDTVLAEFIVGSGAFTIVESISDFEITAGATGVQKLKIKAKNFEALSSLHASVYAAEVS